MCSGSKPCATDNDGPDDAQLFDGGSAKNIALNTVGSLFVLSVDNDAYQMAMPQATRTFIDEFGRAEITPQDSERIEVARAWGFPFLIVGMTAPIVVTYLVLFQTDITVYNQVRFCIPGQLHARAR